MKKLLNKKGFTLMEMMIVIAIIVILVAIAVPSFNSSLEKANKATDDANYRAAESAALVESLNDDSKGDTFYYDLDAGKLLSIPTGGVDEANYGKSEGKTSSYIKVVISADGVPTTSWEAVAP